jgi:hypothetical protein
MFQVAKFAFLHPYEALIHGLIKYLIYCEENTYMFTLCQDMK